MPPTNPATDDPASPPPSQGSPATSGPARSSAATGNGTSGVEVFRAPVQRSPAPYLDPSSTPTAPGTATPQAVDVLAEEDVEQARLGPSGRYVAAGVLSLVALALAVAVAVVASPRRRRGTH